MFRFVLLVVLCAVIARAFWRVVDGVIEGVTGQSTRSTRSTTSRMPRTGVPMARDPVCGTFVVPGRAVSLVDGRTRLFFCSDACRDKYRARPA
jgi:YHS domain-containing protein